MNHQSPTFIDLFCGCGGFSLGMERAGFTCLAALDFNPQAVAVFRHNFQHVPHILEKDMTMFGPDELSALLVRQEVDVVVGGPPCQGFSTARQRDGANHGVRLKDDSRRHLYKEFLRYIGYFKPRVFVMENVLGIRTAAGGAYFTAVQHEARALGYRVHSQIENAYDLGVPQKRRRQLIIGVRGDLLGYFPTELLPAKRAMPQTNLGAALGDLPQLIAGQGEESRAYDADCRKYHLHEGGKSAKNYLFEVLEVDRAKFLTAHVARPHSTRDLGDFAKLAEGQSSADAMRAGVEFDFPYDRGSFSDRYTRQSRFKPCSTIVAHLSKDGLMFIHPTQNRSLTPREAARIQSFPDHFELPIPRTHQYRVIGNAVPPLIAEAVGDAVKRFLNKSAKQESTQSQARHRHLPMDLHDAKCRFSALASCTRYQLRGLDSAVFLKGWHALLYTFPDLHPDNARDHGDETFNAETPVPGADDLRERYTRSGWPCTLELIGMEAWRRYETGEINSDEFYCVEAQRAGYTARKESKPCAKQNCV